MKKFFLVIFVLCLYGSNIFPQTCKWALNLQTDDHIAVDSAGNVYIAGNFYENSLSLSNNITLVKNNHINTGYISKYNISGTLQWAFMLNQFKGNYIDCITVDDKGFLYTAASFTDTIKLSNDIMLVAPNASYRAYLAKYNSDGKCLWAKATGLDYFSYLRIDHSGNICASTDSYLEMLDPDGNKIWDTSLVSTNDIVMISDIVNDYNNNFYYAAKYYPLSSYDSKIVKKDSWTQYITGTTDDFINGISSDRSNNIYIAGDYTSDTLNCGDNLKIKDRKNHLHYSKGYFSRFSPSGNCEWIKPVTTNKEIFCSDIEAFGDSVYIAGRYNGTTMLLDNDTIQKFYTDKSTYTGFILKCNNSGEYMWDGKITADKDIIMNRIIHDQCGNFYVIGSWYGGRILFNNGIYLDGKHKTNDTNFFIAQYRENSTEVFVNEDLNNSNILRLKPNPASDYFVIDGIQDQNSQETIEIYNSIGEMVLNYINTDGLQQYNISQLSPGIYLIVVKINGSKYYSRLNIIK